MLVFDIHAIEPAIEPNTFRVRLALRHNCSYFMS